VTGVHSLQQEKEDRKWLVTKVTFKVTAACMLIIPQQHRRVLVAISTEIQKFGQSPKKRMGKVTQSV
jgi:hypothetical protein